jgi:hypothetical protein
MEEFTRERSLTGQNSALPCFNRCHLREGHNRLNCPYPNPCSSAKYCGNVEKHPEEKQVTKIKTRSFQMSEFFKVDERRTSK